MRSNKKIVFSLYFAGAITLPATVSLASQQINHDHEDLEKVAQIIYESDLGQAIGSSLLDQEDRDIEQAIGNSLADQDQYNGGGDVDYDWALESQRRMLEEYNQSVAERNARREQQEPLLNDDQEAEIQAAQIFLMLMEIWGQQYLNHQASQTFLPEEPSENIPNITLVSEKNVKAEFVVTNEHLTAAHEIFTRLNKEWEKKKIDLELELFPNTEERKLELADRFEYGDEDALAENYNGNWALLNQDKEAYETMSSFLDEQLKQQGVPHSSDEGAFIFLLMEELQLNGDQARQVYNKFLNPF